MRRKKDYDYYAMFVEMTDYACLIAKRLQDIVGHFEIENLSHELTELHEIEHAADAKTHEMMKNLVKEFLPPIEREDIIALTQELDDVVDSIEDILIRLYMYNVKDIRPEAIEFMDIIVRSCEQMKKMMEEFPSFRKSSKIHEYIIEVNNMEEEGDRLYVEGMRRLYTEEGDITGIVVWSQIFQCFEDCCDACEEVAETVESIIMKNV